MAFILEYVSITKILGLFQEIKKTQKFGDREGKSQAGRCLPRENILKIHFMRYSNI